MGGWGRRAGAASFVGAAAAGRRGAAAGGVGGITRVGRRGRRRARARAQRGRPMRCRLTAERKQEITSASSTCCAWKCSSTASSSCSRVGAALPSAAAGCVGETGGGVREGRAGKERHACGPAVGRPLGKQTPARRQACAAGRQHSAEPTQGHRARPLGKQRQAGPHQVVHRAVALERRRLQLAQVDARAQAGAARAPRQPQRQAQAAPKVVGKRQAAARLRRHAAGPARRARPVCGGREASGRAAGGSGLV